MTRQSKQPERVPMDASQVRKFVLDNSIEFEALDDTTIVCSVAGNNRQKINFVISLGQYSMSVEAFVARRPEDNREQVFEWLLEQNQKLRLCRFSLDTLGDIYLQANLPVGSLSEEILDAVVGEIVATTDRSFNAILQMGFSGAIERERAWRTSRGLDTSNLDHLR